MERLKLKMNSLLLVRCMMMIGVFLTVTQVYAQDWDQMIKLTASDRAQGANFGYSISISGDYAIVGAPKDPSDASGGNILDEAGAAYIFKNNAGTWSLAQKIAASDRADYDYFGWSVAMSGDYAVVGAYFESHDATGGNALNSAGSAYIFKNNGGTWTETQKIVASDREANDYFGYSVSIAGDYIIAGAYGEDHNETGGATMSNSGSAYIFKNNGGTWSQVKKIVASDRWPGDYFGYSVAISGDYAIVGANRDSEDASGSNTLQYSGSAYIFKNTSGNWSEIKKIVANDREFDASFGIAVAISGDNAIVGAFKESKDAAGGNAKQGAGAAYVFSNNSDAWTQTQKLVAGDRNGGDYFGRSVSIHNDLVIVGAYLNGTNVLGADNIASAGSAYIYENSGGSWTQTSKIVASDRSADDKFGYAVAISDSYAFAGAYTDTEDASGANAITGAGSIYIYEQGCALDNSVTVTGNTITANLSGGTYQWVDCNNNNAPIAGETAQSFTPTVSGSYAVEITDNGCTKTSACSMIDVVGIGSIETEVFSVYPNPNNGAFTITSTNSLENASVEVYSLLGVKVYQDVNATGTTITIDMKEQNNGVYFVKVNGQTITKVVKR